MFNIKTDFLQKIKPIYLFIILYFTFAIFSFLTLSVWAFEVQLPANLETNLFKIICYICIIFNIFVYKVYNIKKFIIHLILTGIVVFISHTTNYNYLSWMWFYLLSIPPVSFKTISKTVLAIVPFIMGLILILIGLDYGDCVVSLRPATTIQRYYYGFVSPNIFAACLLQICMALVYVRWNKIKATDNLFMFSVLCLTFFFTNSRTTSILLLLLMLLANLAQKIKNEPCLNILNISANSLLIFCPSISFIITELLAKGSHIALWIDDLMSYRFRNLCYCLATEPVNLWGTELKVHHDLMVLNNLYGIVLIRYGIFIFSLFIICLAAIIRKAYLKKDIPLIIILIISLIQGISGKYFIMPYINYAFLTFTCLLNNTKLFEKS